MNAEERPFPIVHPRPSLRDALRTMSSADMVKFAAVAGLSFPLGFLVGAWAPPRPRRRAARHGGAQQGDALSAPSGAADRFPCTR